MQKGQSHIRGKMLRYGAYLFNAENNETVPCEKPQSPITRGIVKAQILFDRLRHHATTSVGMAPVVYHLPDQ